MTQRLRASLTILALLASLFIVAGCSAAGSTGNVAPPAPSATPTPKIAHAGQSADQILAGLKAKGMPIGASITFTAATDQNNLLGRPGQYTGKDSFKDTRVPDSGNQGVDISVSDGGSIEVFANLADAMNRTN